MNFDDNEEDETNAFELDTEEYDQPISYRTSNTPSTDL